MTGLSFRLIADDRAARCGEIMTPHGPVATPAFMPVGTQATVKALAPGTVRATGADIVLGNNYHLMLRPGAERVAMLGRSACLHELAARDSHGFRRISSDVAVGIAQDRRERCHLPLPSRRRDRCASPERAVEVQALPALTSRCSSTSASSCRPPALTSSGLCASRCAGPSAAGARSRRRGPVRCIVQGGDDIALRQESLHALVDIGFHGYAIGGLAVGESPEVTNHVVGEVAPALPASAPRYLMGVGTPENLLDAVTRGVDMFDCVLPTRNGRHGVAFTRRGPVSLKNARHTEDPRPLDEGSSCPVARTYSRAYLHHPSRPTR
jgi:queuine tRNA-ribosyltransferase